MKKMKTVFCLIFSAFLLLSCGENEKMPDYLKIFSSPKATVTVTLDKMILNPADRLTLTVSYYHEDGALAQMEWDTMPSLPLLETFEKPQETVFRFDSALPGSYTLSPLRVIFADEEPIVTETIEVTVAALTEEGTTPEEPAPIFDDRFDFFLLFLILAALFLLILIAVLVFLLFRYKRLRRKLQQTVTNQSVGILEALQKAVTENFETLEIDKAAVLILQTTVIPLQEKAEMELMLRSFDPETVVQLRNIMEKYQKVAFAKASVEQSEMNDDLHFLIGFHKQFANCRRVQSEEQ